MEKLIFNNEAAEVMRKAVDYCSREYGIYWDSLEIVPVGDTHTEFLFEESNLSALFQLFRIYGQMWQVKMMKVSGCTNS